MDETSPKSIHSSPITVSIVVPMRNEERYIAKCLGTILANDYPLDQCEILVVDGCSTDCSRTIVEQIAAQNGAIRLLDNPGGVAPIAMNIGIRAARGTYVLRMDAHSEYPSNYIRTCLEELERTGADNVGGRWITRPGSDSLVARAIALMTQHPVAVGNAAYRIGLGDRFVDTVPFGAFRRSLFDKIGYYREDLVRHQDYELNARIREAGGKIYLSSKIDVTYYNVPNLSRFLYQAYGNGMWMARSWLTAPRSFSLRHAAPLALFSCLLASLVLSPFSKLAQTLLATTAALYFLSVLAASVQISLRHGAIFLLVLPVLLPLYHLCYGAATLMGFLRYPFTRTSDAGVVSPIESVCSSRTPQPPIL